MQADSSGPAVLRNWTFSKSWLIWPSLLNRLTTPTRTVSSAAFDVFVAPLPQVPSSKIVFATNRDGSMQIYTMYADGSGASRLTYSGANDDFPRWSPNGTKILFQSDRDHPDTGYNDIYVMNFDGSGVTRLTTEANDDGFADWSPDGAKIVFQSMRNGVSYQVYSMNADGSNQINLSNSTSNDSAPSWSPDGTKVAFASDRDHPGFDSIYVMNSNGGNQQRLTFSSGVEVEDTQPAWSRDGSRIAFVSTRDSTTETWQEADDYEIPEDDGQIFNRSRFKVNKEIYVMNADGSNQTRLTVALEHDDLPAWSPDGTKIVFRSEREREAFDPTPQIWTMNADGTNQINVSNSGTSDFSASLTSSDFIAAPLADTSRPNESPVANAGGPYLTQTGQSIQLNGTGSYDPNGTIVSYSWNFGDGTSGTGSIVDHQYSAAGVYPVSLAVTDNSGNSSSSQEFVTIGSVSVPVRINFDELPNNFPVGDHYLNSYGVRFYSDNTFYPVRTWQNCGICSTTSPPNFVWTSPNITGQVIVEFTHPVSNLSFYIIGLDAFFNQFAILDVYRNNSLYATLPIFGNGTFTRQFSLGTLDNINKIVIRGITDPAGIGFDDFTFNVPSDIQITSARVGGYLNGTTQNALLGGDIALQATPLPGGFAGGTYSWSFTGPYQPLTGTNSSSVTIRSTAVTGDPSVGPITATVTYNKNGFIATASVTINSVLPTLTSFTAEQGNSQVVPPGGCTGTPLWHYKLGCLQSSPPPDRGIHFTANVHANSFISDPTKSGIKYVQAVSLFRKWMSVGLRCSTSRSQELNVDSGWQLDTGDPYLPNDFPVRRFSEGNDLTMFAADYPSDILTGFQAWQFADSMYVDDQFWMHVVYFAGDNPANPFRQRAIGRLRWNWGGQVVFDPFGADFKHRLRFANVGATVRTGEPTSSMVTMQGVATAGQADVPCPGGPPLSANHVDSSRVLVREYYSKILGRSPDDGGWNWHTSQIAQCVFDVGCNQMARSYDALGFFFSAEFIQLISQVDPVMMHPPGTPGFNAAEYNPRFVFWCYMKLLSRDPFATGDEAGFNYHLNLLNSTGDYGLCVKGFIYSPEYRNLPHF